MKKIEVKSGERFERLTVIREARGINKHRRFMCSCECGNEKIVSLTHLRNGLIRSCGCLHKEGLLRRITKHGDSRTRLYTIWINMKDRCYNPSNRAYKNYGGRGISICKEWHSFESFKSDMVKDYLWHKEVYGEADTTIERINVNGNYCLENCHWATKKEQARNKRGKVQIEILGHLKMRSEWAEYFGIDKTLFKSKIKTLKNSSNE